MKTACYGRPGGPLVTPEDFIKRAGPNYKRDGIFPYCEACGEKVDLYGVHNPNATSRFDHMNLSSNADPLDDCILANRSERFRGLQPTSLNEEYGKILRQKFFENENLKKVYIFMWLLCGKGNLPVIKVVNCIKRADAKGIWRYADLPLWVIPFVLLSLDNFKFKNSGSSFHFVINKRKSTNINEIWEDQTATLDKIFSDSGKLVNFTGKIKNPFPIKQKEYEILISSINWDNDNPADKIISYFPETSSK